MSPNRPSNSERSYGVGMRHILISTILLIRTVSGAEASAQAAAPSGPAPDPKAGSVQAKSMQDIGAQAFASHCAVCHAAVIGTEGFRHLTPREIYTALRHGQMQEAATGLDDGQLHALAQTFGNPRAAEERPADGGAVRCSAPNVPGAMSSSWSGFSNDATNTRVIDQPRTKEDIQRLQVKWVFAFPDTGFWKGAGNPVAVANGRVYVTSTNHWVYALDAQTGCALWSFEADAGIRSGAAVEAGVVTFGDLRGNAYGLDEKTGVLRWRHLTDPQSFVRITGNVTAEGGRVLVPVSNLEELLAVHPDRSCCTAIGSTAAYDIQTGKPMWQTYMIDQPLQYEGKTPRGVNRYGPSGASVFSSPTVDSIRGLVYVGTGNQTTGPFVPTSDAVVALDAKTGAKRWVKTLAPVEFGGQDIYNVGCEVWMDPQRQGCPPENPGPGGHGDRDLSAAVMLVRRPDGKEVLVAGSKDGTVYALDPDAQGKVLWRLRIGKGGELGGIEYGMATDGKLVYAPITDYDYSTRSGDGSLNAIDLMTGKLVWRAAAPRDTCKHKEDGVCVNAIFSPPVVVGDAVIVGAMDGVLRAYDKLSGRVFWSYDSVRPYAAVNGIAGKGGSFGMGGVSIVGDMMFITSGSSLFGLSGLKGNVLLAFQLGSTAKH